jgi:hypothetical protein
VIIVEIPSSFALLNPAYITLEFLISIGSNVLNSLIISSIIFNNSTYVRITSMCFLLYLVATVRAKLRSIASFPKAIVQLYLGFTMFARILLSKPPESNNASA